LCYFRFYVNVYIKTICLKSSKNIASLKTVAEIAGVSIATVSRVLNADPVVKAETRLAVQKAIKNSGYHPNRVAQRLRSTSGSGKLVGLLIPDIQNPFYVDVIRGIEEYAYEKGSAVVIGNFSQDQKKEKLYIDILRSESVDGFIVAPYHGADQYVVELINEGRAVVCIDRGLTGIGVDVVKSDNERGAFIATEHLVNAGHTRIAHITGNPFIPTTQERIDGYVRALQKHGLPVLQELILGKDSDFKSGVEIAAALIDLPEPPTAIFAANNLVTLGALETILSRGLKIPEEMAIVGFDDVYWATSLNPPLTAVRQHGFEIGRRAIELLYQRIADPSRPAANVIIQTELMIRKSCGFKTVL
jgi:LacI family transcriptional regulator/LacI family repressor for deo operon, udp, cdd, tsx, nupC, and nupG